MFFYISVWKGKKITGSGEFILRRQDCGIKGWRDFMYICKLLRDGKSIDLCSFSTC
jgi:hypothetical protein